MHIRIALAHVHPCTKFGVPRSKGVRARGHKAEKIKLPPGGTILTLDLGADTLNVTQLRPSRFCGTEALLPISREGEHTLRLTYNLMRRLNTRLCRVPTKQRVWIQVSASTGVSLPLLYTLLTWKFGLSATSRLGCSPDTTFFFLEWFTRQHVTRDTWHVAPRDRRHRRSAVPAHRMSRLSSGSAQPFRRYSRNPCHPLRPLTPDPVSSARSF